MALGNAEKQARWHDRHLVDGTKARVIFDASTNAQLDRLARHRAYTVTALIEEWAASAERRAPSRLSGKLSRRTTTANRCSDRALSSAWSRFCCKTIFGAGTKNSFLAPRSNQEF